MTIHQYLRFFVLFFALFTSLSSFADERDEEIKTLMWGGADADFQTTEIPQKWKNESAIIIAQLNRFEYKKPPIISELHVEKYFHNRIKLNDKSAINDYSEISYPNDRGRQLKVYTGIKLIKPDGREIQLNLADAVEIEKEINGKKQSYKKIAIPNLEAGDILDYYICQDKIIPTASKIYYFDPVLFYLPQEYPVIKQKLQFGVQRRCFISLRSMNGAPNLKLSVDEENDEQHYVLEDNDREAVKDVRWFYPYRELPAIKFRAAYASGKALRQNDVLLGEPGVVKSSVSKKELCDFVAYLISNTLTDPKAIIKYVKKNVDKNASNFEKAKAGYYYQRNHSLSYDEILTVSDKEEWNSGAAYVKDSKIQFLDRFSGFLANMDIPYDIVIAIPRDISSLDDLLLEHELKFLFRVKQGSEYLYFSPIDNFVMPGVIDPELQGAEAYVVDGLADFKDWDPKRIKIPVTDKMDNKEEGDISVKIGENFNRTDLAIKKTVSGNFKSLYQLWLLDYYDYEKEERSKYDMSEAFAGTLWLKKKLLTLKESYMSNRDKMKNGRLKSLMTGQFDFKIDTMSNLSIEQTGRFEATPDLVYSYDMQSEDLLNRVGKNYLFDVGKLIEKQVKIEEKELNRKQGIYINSPRSYKYKITIDIPKGYQVQGLDKLNKKTETPEGGFASTAKIDNNQIVIETFKHYDTIEAASKEWPEFVKFLNAAHQFTEQKILFKKI